jgi:excisionase family DNA binding protein
MQENYRTTEEVAALFRTTPATVRYWRTTGRLKGVRLGRKVLYSDTELADWTEAERRRQADSGASPSGSTAA